MKKPHRTIILAALLAMLGTLAWLCARPGEPEYQGKKLSRWLGQYEFALRWDREGWERSNQAVLHIGTNALPTLLRMIAAHDSTLKLKVRALKFRVMNWLDPRDFLFDIDFRDASHQTYQAKFGFRTLGTNAIAATPNLVGIYLHSSSPKIRENVIESLGFIDPSARDAAPLLFAAITNADSAVSRSAIEGLGKISGNPGLTVPVLAKIVNATKSDTRVVAIHALQDLGTEARPAIPDLLHAFEDGDSFIRNSIMNALGAIDPEAAAKAGVQ